VVDIDQCYGVYACVCVCMRVYACVCVCMRVYACVRVWQCIGQCKVCHVYTLCIYVSSLVS
jgi:hypothetical protein